MKRNEKMYKSILMGLIILGMTLFAYFVVSSVQAESEAIDATVSGRLVLPEGSEIPQGMQVGILFPDYESPPQPYPAPILAEPTPRSPENQNKFDPALGPENLKSGFGLDPIDIELPEQETYVYEPPISTALVDVETGEFTLPLSQYGIYVLSLIPPEGSYLTTNTTVYVEASGSETNLGDIQVFEAQLAGTFNKPNDEGLAEGYAILSNDTGSFYKTARSVGGRYFMSDIPAGTYSLQGFPSSYQNEIYQSDTLTVTIEDGADTLVRPIQFKGPDIFGTVYDHNNEPLSGAEVYIYSIDEGIFTQRYAYSNDAGEWQFGNLRDGGYRIRSTYYDGYYEQSLVPPEPFDIELPGVSLPLDLKFESWPIGLKVVSGQLVDQYGIPATNGTIYASNYERNLFRSAATDAEGRFQLDLVGGSWNLDLYHDYIDEVDWVNSNPPVEIEFALDDTEEVRSIQIEVNRFDAYVTGKVVSSDPNISDPDYQIYLYSPELGVGVNQYVSAGSPFIIKAPEGTYILSTYLNTNEFAPIPDREVSLLSGQTIDIGDIIAIAPSATIKGNVSTATGDPVAGVEVFAYPVNGQDFERFGKTDENGDYEIKVVPGELSLYIYGYLSDYYHDGTSKTVVIGEEETVENVDFTVLEKNSTISVTIVDSDGEKLNGFDGWVSISGVGNPFSSGEYFENGYVEIRTIEGNFDVFFEPYGIGYVFPREKKVVAVAGETADVQFQAIELDKQIAGRLYDIRTEETVIGLTGWVYGQAEGYVGWVDSQINASTGEYELDVTDGNWYVDWYLSSAPTSEYSIIPSVMGYVGISDTMTTTLDIPLVRSDASVSGQVTDSEGAPISDGYVYFEGKDELAGFSRSVTLAPSGEFYAALPYGEYIVRTGWYYSNPDEFPPEPMTLLLEPDENKTGFSIQYRKADVPLTVSLFAPGLTSGGDLYVSLSSPNAGYRDIKTHLSSDGENGFATFTEQLLDGTWYIYANYYNEDSDWVALGPILIDGPTEVQLDMHQAIYSYPSDSIDIEEGQPLELVLDNGASVYSPGGFLPEGSTVEGVSLIGGYFLPLNGQMEPVGFTYNFYGYDPYITNDSLSFTSPVSVTLPYDASIEDFVSPSDLRIMFHEVDPLGSLDSPTIIEGIVVDEVNRTVSFEVGKFGYFGIVAPAELMPVSQTFSDVFQHQIVMPFIVQ